MTLEQITQQAQALTPVERIRLVESILVGLGPVDPEIEKKWAAESDARLEAFRRGELDAKDWETVRRELPR